MTTVCLIYDNIVRPDTTGTHCLTALTDLGIETHHFQPLSRHGNDLVFLGYDRLPPCDFYLQIDDDLSYPGPIEYHPNAYWCIDTHRMEEMVGGWNRLKKSKGFDKIFVAQKDGTTMLYSEWLPLAFNPSVHRKLPATKKIYDWCFIGNREFAIRKKLIEALAPIFPNHYVGNLYGEDLVLTFNRSRIILNISVANDINMRYFEAQGCGGLLLTNRVDNGEDELFEHLATYNSVDDLLKKIRYYLNNDDIRATQAAAQHSEVLLRHTYQERMLKILSRLALP